MPHHRLLCIVHVILMMTGECMSRLAEEPSASLTPVISATPEPPTPVLTTQSSQLATALPPPVTSPDSLQRPTEPKCFHTSREDCPPSTAICKCQPLKENPKAVVCCDVTEYLLKEGLNCAGVGGNDSVTELHIRNATLDELNITRPNFKRLKSLSVTDGRINKVIGGIAKFSSLSCLNLSNNALNSIENRAVVHLNKLVSLDLSRNNLTDVPRFRTNSRISLDISGNNELNCHSLNAAFSENNLLEFRNGNETFCSSSKTFNWFNTTEKVTLAQVERLREVEKECSDNCTCVPQRLDIVEGKPAMFVFKVDCSGKQLLEMPSKLPPNTIALNISNNNITILKFDDASYDNIRELYADNNQITSILDLEGTKFIDNFVMLTLRNNKLESLPAYMLSNIFDRNYNSRQVHLGLNRLKCDCNTAKVLKVWLITKQKNILDYDEILCKNYPLKVVQLDQAKMCQHQNDQDWTDYIYYIITAEVLLLLCLILKVSYDYWVFKTAGYLPWPASKMPKLPCDWLCE